MVTARCLGGWQRLEILLEAHDGTTKLRFVQHLMDAKQVGETGPGWEYYLDMLVAARAGQTQPDFADYYPAQREHFATQVLGQ